MFGRFACKRTGRHQPEKMGRGGIEPPTPGFSVRALFKFRFSQCFCMDGNQLSEIGGGQFFRDLPAGLAAEIAKDAAEFIARRGSVQPFDRGAFGRAVCARDPVS